MIWRCGNPGLRFICLMAILTALILAAGCTALDTQTVATTAATETPTPTDTPAPTDTPEPPLNAAAVLQQAASRMLDLRTATFELEHRKGSTVLFPGVEINRAFGVVDVAGRKYQVVVEAQSATPQAYIEITVMSVDGEVRMTDLFTGRWLVVPQSVLPVDFSQFGVTLADIIQAVMLSEPVRPELVGIENLAGVETHHVSGSISSQEMMGLVPGAGEGCDVGVDVWVEMPEGLVHQVLLSGRVLSTDISGTERLLTLGDFDLPVVIDLPE
jgi:hypothetical protein